MTYNVAYMINRIIFKRRRDHTKCAYNLFLAVEPVFRISLPGFSDLQSAVYAECLHNIPSHKRTAFAQLST